MKAIAKIADKVDRKNDETKRYVGAVGGSYTLKANDFNLYNTAGTVNLGINYYPLTPVFLSTGATTGSRVGNEINWVGT